MEYEINIPISELDILTIEEKAVLQQYCDRVRDELPPGNKFIKLEITNKADLAAINLIIPQRKSDNRKKEPILSASINKGDNQVSSLNPNDDIKGPKFPPEVKWLGQVIKATEDIQRKLRKSPKYIDKLEPLNKTFLGEQLTNLIEHCQQVIRAII